MQSVVALIDKASQACGGDSALARHMGISKTLISLMRSGERGITPATAAELADIAGDDARQAAIDAIIEGAKGTRKENTLREILGKARAAGGAEMCHISYSDDSISAMDSIAKTRKIVKDRIHRIYQGLLNILGDSAKADRALACG